MLEAIESGLAITAVGLLAVFVVLAGMAGLVSLLGRLDRGWQERERAQAEARTRKAPTIDDLTLVLITAAVATVIQGRFHVKRIRRIPSVRSRAEVWSQVGRAVLQGSHVILKK